MKGDISFNFLSQIYVELLLIKLIALMTNKLQLSDFHFIDISEHNSVLMFHSLCIIALEYDIHVSIALAEGRCDMSIKTLYIKMKPKHPLFSG